MLYLHDYDPEASPKAISRRTSYLQVRLAFHRYPQLIPRFFNTGGFGPPRNFTSASSWPWIGHPVSGLQHDTIRPFKTRFPFGSGPSVLNLASYRNSPVRSTKSTRSHLNVLPQLVNIGFQVLFHSPPGVLFTFPSRYCSTIGHQVVFSLGGWSPLLPTGFHVSRGTLDTGRSSIAFAYRTVTFFGPPFQTVRLAISDLHSGPQPQPIAGLVWALSRSLATT